MKRGIAGLLCLVMVLSLVFAGCGADPKAELIGKWEGELDATEGIKELFLASAGDMGEYIELDRFVLKLTMEFREDGTCTMSIDPDALQAAFSSMVQSVGAGLTQYFEQLIEEKNLEMTVDEMLEASGMGTMDELLDMMLEQAMAEINSEDLVQDGKYIVKNGTLFISDDMDAEYKAEDASAYTVKDGKLTFRMGGLEDLGMDEVEMTLTKVS